MILIDNYDSFTYNIVQYLEELGVTPCVIPQMIWVLSLIQRFLT